MTQTVLAEQRGIRLPDFVEMVLGDAERSFVRALLREGRVRVNGLPQHRPARLRHGDVVEIRLGRRTEEVPRHRPAPGTAADLTVLHRDDACVVVHKPAGMVTVPERWGGEKGVHGLLEERFPGEDLRIVHRLDRGTSGCLLLARGREAAAALDLAFRERRVAKRYLAVVRGVLRQHTLRVEAPLGPDVRRPGLVRVFPRGGRRSREAVTEFRVLERFAAATFLEAHPLTGRTHQVRVHLAWIRHPLWVDADYGGHPSFLLSQLKADYRPRPGVPERPLMERLSLHAASLRFPSPAGGEVEVEAPLPRDFAVLLAKMRKFAPAGAGAGGSP